MSTELMNRLESVATSMVKVRAEDYLRQWSPEVDRDAGALTAPAVIFFEYADEEKNPENVSFHLMPGNIVPMFFASQSAKVALREVIDTFLKQPLAAGVIVVSESWTVATEDMAKAEEYRKLDTLRDSPDAMTAIQGMIYAGDGYVTILIQAIKDGHLEGPVRKVRTADSKSAVKSNIDLAENLG